MAGKEVHFQHQSMLYSDIYEFGFEAVGEGRSVICGKARSTGYSLWNVWEQVKAACGLIAAQEGSWTTRRDYVDELGYGEIWTA